MTLLIRDRRGIALIATLSMIAATGAIVAALSGFSRDSRLASLNRVHQIRGLWAAEGCAVVIMAQIDTLLNTARGPNQVNGIWSALDTTMSRVRQPDGLTCAVALVPSGTTRNVNSITASELRVLLGASIPPERRDSLVDAFFDWRDADSTVREHGAELEWYQAASRPPPRNGPFVNIDELRAVRGWERSGIINDLSIEEHRVVLDRASRAVLLSLDGLPAEAVEWIDGHRSQLRGQDVSAIIDHLSLASQSILAGSYAHLRAVTAPAPDLWYLDCAVPDQTGKGVRLRLTLMRAGNRVIVAKRSEGFL